MTRQKDARRTEIALVGATGFTGGLVADYLFRRSTTYPLRLTFAGRSPDRLAALRDRLSRRYPQAPLPVLESVDLADEAQATELAASSHVIISTAGPYARVGDGLVAACAANGTHYVDLTGEVPWMRRIIDAHGEAAARSGACMIPCCGFDSVPSDLGVLLLYRSFRERYGCAPQAMRMVFGRSEGGFSGGTVASLIGVLDEARRDGITRAVLSDPDSLLPDWKPARPPQDGPHAAGACFDRFLQQWTAPFPMAPINERIVRRSNSLLGVPLGENPDYREVIAFRRGPGGMAAALLTALAGHLTTGLLLFRPTRALLLATALPEPGSGPRVAQEGGGSFTIRLHGYADSSAAGGPPATVAIGADRDPGYGATAVMIAESAILLLDGCRDGQSLPAGFQTPASALGLSLVERLNAAGIRFSVEMPRAG